MVGDDEEKTDPDGWDWDVSMELITTISVIK